MSNLNNVTSAEELQAKIEGKMYDYFTFPVLDITIKYRRPDLLKLSFNDSLPNAVASLVIDSYKKNIEGISPAEYKKSLKDNKIEADDALVKDLSVKGYKLLATLSVSHRIMDVEESDFSNNVLSWNDVPEEDAIAFIFHIINKAQTADAPGGETSNEDVINFPDGKRRAKRNLASASVQDVRESAE